MLKNYFKTAWRNVVRNKVFSFINIIGLSIGLATCMLIMIYIDSETGYDVQNKNADRIFRVAYRADEKVNAKEKSWAATAAPLAWGLKSDMPGVEQTTRLLKFPSFDKMLLKYEHDKKTGQFYETNGYYVDSTFFQVFTYDFKYGVSGAALNEANSVVISEEVSDKMFGNENPVGKTIDIGLPFGNFKYTVKGVFKDAHIKSHIPAHLFLSMRNGDIGGWVDQQSNWATNNIFHTHVKLKAGVDPESFEKKLKPFMDRRGGADLKALGIARQLFLQPLLSIHLHSDLDGEIAINGNIKFLYILGSIALFVLVIACINFMNLSTARSAKRAKEVGVRKVMGANKKSLVYQFLGESVMMSFFALLLSMVTASLFLPVFNNLTQKNLLLFDDPQIWLWIAILALFTGVVSGLYPAVYLSSFKPISVLKGKILNSFSAVTIRKGLVVFQFTISICLIVGAIVIASQLQYMNDQQLGFNKDQQVILPLQDQQAMKYYAVLKDELLKNPDIINVTAASTYPGIPNVEDLLFYAEGKTKSDQVDIHLATVENDYFKTLGLSIIAGRGFSKEFTGDSNSIVLNETAVRELGYDTKTVVGKKINTDFQGVHSGMVIRGVVKDFNFESLYNTIKPFGFTTSLDNPHSYVIANVRTSHYTGLIKEMENAWGRVNPGIPFEYSFLDNELQKNYQKDQRAAAILSYFTMVAIGIACLGLFGLSAFSAEQRTREIGIRKVLGASATNVASLLSKDFIKLVLLATVIGSPLAWFIMNKWLEDFAYRIDVSWWMIAIAGLLAILIALITVSLQTIRAAIANPVKSLRTE